jgi:N-methylhydantoinase A
MGSLPTVTDANLVLGRLTPDYFLGGKIPLDLSRARSAIQALGASLRLDEISTALGVVDVVNAHMERALRVISVERGHDPRDFTLLSFGGAGGLHACELARRLGIRKVLIPPQASVLSALGMLVADVIKDYSLTVMLPGDTSPSTIDAALQPLIQSGIAELESEGFSVEHIQVLPFLDMRYRGQSYELIIPYSADYLDSFHTAHLREFGYRHDEAPVEIVNVRLRVVGPVTAPHLPHLPVGHPSPASAQIALREVAFQEGVRSIPFYLGEKLSPGNRLTSPAVILRPDTTILVSEGFTGRLDGYGNLSLDMER